MKSGTVILFVLAAISAVFACNNVAARGGINSSLSVSYAVGAFLVPLLLLIAALASMKKK